MPYVQSILNEAISHFDKLKEVMNKHPNAFSINYSGDEGYILSIDLDLIETPPTEGDSNTE